ncbi:MAG: DUF2786 domain-containing protein [Actinobacteria bacterium]|uniref:Unannotated protein n=1 Tax=freshwater metagenome TaxID=449393 RepID=A0A6J6AHJ1_9ZZZZ|nr:DUF2786 domain-containing protein [Actinomycetota bacterium]MSZ60183.1 DUF2786 domain-containing protein [Actinomycetota bacterium]MSZ80762.1 DUF2786 domain-containing protein [Actinomycetota bacterium]MTB12801.1 DUF2786 domain-containing protein [Actinomycetota bacterium]
MSDQRDRINAMLNLAQHPNTPLAEAESALAMASKLMQKHGLSQSDVSSTHSDNDTTIVVERIHVGGLYRVRRQNILYTIALLHSCAGYRAEDEGDKCVIVLYGRAADIFATRTLFAAADAMGARLLPRGDRSWRVAWWKGFQLGIEESLSVARKDFVAETPGSGLVLADRMKRAQHELRVNGPPLRGGYSYSDTSSGAYLTGKQAGSGFGGAGRSFAAGIRGELS